MSYISQLCSLMRFQTLIFLLHVVFAPISKALPQPSDDRSKSVFPRDGFTVASAGFSDGAPDLSNPSINQGPNDRTSINTDPNAVSLFNSDAQSDLLPGFSSVGLQPLQGPSIDQGTSVELAGKPAGGAVMVKAVDHTVYMCCIINEDSPPHCDLMDWSTSECIGAVFTCPHIQATIDGVLNNCKPFRSENLDNEYFEAIIPALTIGLMCSIVGNLVRQDFSYSCVPDIIPTSWWW